MWCAAEIRNLKPRWTGRMNGLIGVQTNGRGKKKRDGGIRDSLSSRARQKKNWYCINKMASFFYFAVWFVFREMRNCFSSLVTISRTESHTKSNLNIENTISTPARADRTRHVVVIDEFKAMVEWWRQGKTEHTRWQKPTTILICQTGISWKEL